MSDPRNTPEAPAVLRCATCGNSDLDGSDYQPVEAVQFKRLDGSTTPEIVQCARCLDGATELFHDEPGKWDFDADGRLFSVVPHPQTVARQQASQTLAGVLEQALTGVTVENTHGLFVSLIRPDGYRLHVYTAAANTVGTGEPAVRLFSPDREMLTGPITMPLGTSDEDIAGYVRELLDLLANPDQLGRLIDNHKIEQHAISIIEWDDLLR